MKEDDDFGALGTYAEYADDFHAVLFLAVFTVLMIAVGLFAGWMLWG